ncbi:MAG: putative phage abortive infection protein [Pedobacter sp.]|nr:putative phage abortive infection protein [Pedobacter sp.]
MNDKSIKNLTISLLIFTGVVFVYFLVFVSLNGYWIWHESLDFAATGQFGDFVGGFLGTVFNGAAFYFLYLTLNEQRKSSLKQGFETKLYDIIRLHRENVTELKYTKFYKKELKTSESRKVFRIIVEEFIDCYHEIQRFCKMYPEMEILQPGYQILLEKILKENKVRATIKELALLDIAFCFFYFGAGKESETILLHKFYNRYNKNFVHRLKIFLQLKPKEEIKFLFSKWEEFKSKGISEMKKDFEMIYSDSSKSEQKLQKTEKHSLLPNLHAEKYYGGHQHRLGHYFRHLFQSYKFLSSQNFLTSKEKYFYGKSLRSQFSTYEQFMLFFNSLSSLGMVWEYTAEIENSSNNDNLEDFKFITRYNLIKNLPGSQYFDFTYRKFYPKVEFEYMDDITYTNRISNDYRNKTNKV